MPKIGEALLELAVVPALGWPSKLVHGRDGVCSIEDNSAGATCPQDAPVLKSRSCVAGLTIEAMQASRTAPQAAPDSNALLAVLVVGERDTKRPFGPG